MSNIVIRVNESSAGEGFLIAPDGARTFPVSISLSTNDGSTVSATVDATPNKAGIVLPAGAVSLGPTSIIISITATAQSVSRGDTVINVHAGGATKSFKLTAIRNPVVLFRGRFEARFATDGDYYNNPRGNDGGTVGFDPSMGPGWTWALEGEPDFVPADSVATSVVKPVGRVVRFNNPIALRMFAAPVATNVNMIQGSTASGVEKFIAGDPMIGATVNLGPNTYLAANASANPVDPPPAETNMPGFEPMALFECHIDGFLSGKSATVADRPTASGLVLLDAAEKATPQFIDPATGTAMPFISLATFEQRRLAQLHAAFNALSPADQTGTAAGRNLKTRIDHLSPNSTTLQFGWNGKEEYKGLVNTGITFQPTPSSVLDFLKGFPSFAFFAKLFTFHNDELCGYVDGSLTAG